MEGARALRGKYPFYHEIVKESLRRKIFVPGCRYYLAMLATGDTGEPYHLKDVIRRLEDIFGLSRKQIVRMLARFNGTFWDYTRGTGRYEQTKVRLYSASESAVKLGVCSGFPEWKPLAELKLAPSANAYKNVTDSLTEIASPLTKQNLSDMLNVSPRSQLYYNKKMGTKETPNHIIAGVYETIEAAEEAFARFNYRPGVYRIVNKPILRIEDKQYQCVIIIRRIGNSRPGAKYTQEGRLKCLGRLTGTNIWVDKQVGHELRRYLAPALGTSSTEGCEPSEHPDRGFKSLRDLRPSLRRPDSVHASCGLMITEGRQTNEIQEAASNEIPETMVPAADSVQLVHAQDGRALYRQKANVHAQAEVLDSVLPLFTIDISNSTRV